MRPSQPRSPRDGSSARNGGPVGSCRDCAHRDRSNFGVLTPRGLTQLDEGRKCNTFLRGQVLYSEGNTAVAAFCIRSGRVKLYRTLPDGGTHILRVAGPGDTLGAANVVAELPYAETAEVVEPARICLFTGSTLWAVLRSEPMLWEGLVRSLCSEIARLQETLLVRAHRSARAKLADLLLGLCPDGGGKREVELTYSRRELADMAGVSEETAVRLLSELRELKVIGLRGRRLTVLRPEVLRERVGPGF